MSDAIGGSSQETPPEVVHFHEVVPVFRMLEFSMFPEERLGAEEWQRRQEELLSADPASLSIRVLIDLPDGDMLSFDLNDRKSGFPLAVSQIGFPEDAAPLGLTMSEYLDLATELSPLEAQMFAGVYPYDAIVSAFERRGLHGNAYWSECLSLLAESRGSTEERMRYVRESTQ
ncbi:hypothetical protein [Microbacterium sp. JB110]|uniref:hypothetical protein n=1 Tax=unclassified Microbacterium TaxID=2609290 RepID=UPI001124A3B9|nr:hypothetical protein [Microbacterium sp. JB110]